MGAPLRLGVDLGGTKIELLALGAAGEECWRKRVPTPAGDYAATLSVIAGLVREAETALGRRGTLGLGIPGSESPATGLIRNANSTCLIGKPLRRDLENLLAREVRLANDANCFALSEAVDGAAAGAATVFGVILGTGVGGGLVVDGRVLVGANAIAGEWGHNPMPSGNGLPSPGREGDDPVGSFSLWESKRLSPGSLPEEGMAHAPSLRASKCHPPNPLPKEGGDWLVPSRAPGEVLLPLCYCGRRGCVETFLSGPGLAADHRRATGRDLDAAAVAAGAAAGDAACEVTLGRYEARLALALSTVVNLFDPEVVVLGGGLSNMERLYVNVPRLWAPHIFSDTVRTRLSRHHHGDSSGVRGAAWLWP